MKRNISVLLILLMLLLSGCSSSIFNYDIGSKNINEIVDTDIYKNINASMKLSEVSTFLGGYNNYFEDEQERKFYEFYLDGGTLTAVIEPLDNSWHTSYSFKPSNLELNNFFKINTEFIVKNKKWIYIKQNKKIKIIIILEGNRVDEILLY